MLVGRKRAASLSEPGPLKCFCCSKKIPADSSFIEWHGHPVVISMHPICALRMSIGVLMDVRKKERSQLVDLQFVERG